MAALSFPLPLATFLDRLPVESVLFDDPVQQEQTGLGSGALIRATLGPQLWRGEVRLRALKRHHADEVAALLSLLRAPGASFLLTDPRRNGPRDDPGGTVLGAAEPEIAALDAGDGRLIGLGELPEGYTLRRGDLLSFPYLDAASATLVGLHRVVTGTVTAGGDGKTGLFQVTPPLRPGALVGAAVELKRPVCKAALLPGDSPGQGRAAWSNGAGFQFVQVLA